MADLRELFEKLLIITPKEFVDEGLKGPAIGKALEEKRIQTIRHLKQQALANNV